jgi:hypothetical protein
VKVKIRAVPCFCDALRLDGCGAGGPVRYIATEREMIELIGSTGAVWQCLWRDQVPVFSKQCAGIETTSAGSTSQKLQAASAVALGPQSRLGLRPAAPSRVTVAQSSSSPAPPHHGMACSPPSVSA